MKAPCYLPLFFFAFAIGSTARAQVKHDGFADVKWGMSKTEAKASMLERPGTTFDKETANGNLIFDNGTLAGQPVRFYILLFEGDILYGGFINFDDIGDADAQIAQVKRIEASLTEKYGNPSTTKTGDDLRTRVWTLPDDQEVKLRIDKNGDTVLQYYDWETRRRVLRDATSAVESDEL